MALARTATTLLRCATRGATHAHGHAPAAVPTISAELAQKQAGAWGVLTLEEKKQLYRAAFSKTRKELGKGDGDFQKVLVYTAGFTAVALIGFFSVNSLADPVPKTLSKEWKDAEKKRMLEKKMNPVNGISSTH